MFGEHEAAGAIPVIPTKKWFSFRTVRNPDSVLFMPSLRGTRHDSAKIDGGGSNPPGGTSVGRRSSVPDHPVDTSDPATETTLRASQFVCMFLRAVGAWLPTSYIEWRVARRAEPELRSSPVFTSRSGDQIGLQIRSRWVQFLGGVPRPCVRAWAAVWRDSRWSHLWPFDTALFSGV